MGGRWGPQLVRRGVAVLVTLALVGCSGSSKGTSPPNYPTQPSILQGQVDPLIHTARLTSAGDAAPAPAPPVAHPISKGAPDPVLAALGHPPDPQRAPLPAVPPPPSSSPVGVSSILPGGQVPPSPVATAITQLIHAADAAPILPSLVDALSPAIKAVTTAVSAITYRVCAESTSTPLTCSIPLPLGVPIPVFVSHGLLPDVIATLTPFVPLGISVGLAPLILSIAPDLGGLGVDFNVLRLSAGPLAAHVFAVYDIPGTDQQLEYGYDGRRSTLALDSNTVVTIPHLLAGRIADTEIVASIAHLAPGASEAETIALESQTGAGGGAGGATAAIVGLRPVPALMTADVRMQQGAQADDDVTIDTTQPTMVHADLRQTASGASRDDAVLIDQLPSHVAIDLSSTASTPSTTTVTYAASSVVSHLHVTQRTTPEIARSTTFHQIDGDVRGLPSSVRLTLGGISDVAYTAAAVVRSVAAVVQSQQSGVVESSLSVMAGPIPTSLHINYTASPGAHLRYDASGRLASLEVGSYSRAGGGLLAVAHASGLPAHMEFTESSSQYDYTGSAPISTMDAVVSEGGAATIPLPGVDHLSVRRRGSAFGADAQISGVQAAHLALADTTYELALNPGGQPFRAVADIDNPGRVLSLAVSNLPGTLRVNIDPTDGAATYDADAVIRSLDATFSQPDRGEVASLSLAGIPTHVSLHWPTAGADPDFGYTASGRLGSLSAYAQPATGQAAFSATLGDLPPSLTVAGQSPFAVTASAGGAGAPLDHVGSIQLRYGSDGFLPSTGDSDDHVYLDLGSSTRLELLYHGLQSASLDTTGGQLRADLMNTAPRRVDVAVRTSTLTATGFVDRVPAHVNVSVDASDLTYQGSSPIAEIAIDASRPDGDEVQADVLGVPDTAALHLDSSASSVQWSASGSTGAVHALAHLTAGTAHLDRAVDALVSITGVPSHWAAGFGDGQVGLSTAEPIGSIDVELSNHGSVTTFAGDGLSVDADDATGDLDGSVRVADLRSGTFRSDHTGFHLALQMGSGATEAFGIHAEVDHAGSVASADGLISGLPTSLDLTIDGARITYAGDRTATANLTLGHGLPQALRSIGEVPRPHGVAVRDAVGAVRANVYLTGLPTSLIIDPATGVYTVGGFHPSIDPLTLDVVLAHTLAHPLDLIATQEVGTGSPIDLVIGPITVTSDPSGTHHVHASYKSSRPLGPLAAQLTSGDQVAQVRVSNIPHSIDVSANLGAPTKTVQVDDTDPVGSILALYGRRQGQSWLAGARLTDVPRRVAVAVTPGSTQTTTPVFSYSADAPGMGLVAFGDSSAFGNLPSGYAQVAATSLASRLSVTRTGATVDLVSAPQRSGSLTIVGGITLPDVTLPTNPTVPQAALTMNGHVTLAARRVTVAFTNVRSLRLALGYTSAISGDFGSFMLGEQSDTTITLHAQLSSHHVTLAKVDLDNVHLGNVLGAFRVATGTGPWLQRGTTCLQMTPAPQYTTAGPYVTVHGPGPIYATVDPEGLIPDEVTDLIAAFLLRPPNVAPVRLHC